ncbi:MAG: DUF433 domain-containing protein [Steroidobacteraceae bacterium]
MAKLDLERLRRTPTYSFGEAAHYLSMPTATLRAWCVGQKQGDKKEFVRLIDLDGAPKEGLSFLNLVEAHVLASIRRIHNVSLLKVRDALDFVKSDLKIDRPLLSPKFQTDGLDLFVEELTSVLNVTTRVYSFEEIMRAYLKRIRRDVRGVPVKLYPFVRKEDTEKANPPAPIEIDPRVAFGRPVLIGRAVPTAVFADRFKGGDSIEDLAGDFEVTPAAIQEAIRCELDRREAA